MPEVDTVDDVLMPEWPAPASVKACITTRLGGVSDGVYAANNLGLHVGDDPQTVLANRDKLQRWCDLEHQPQWLEQVHGTRVIEAECDGVVRTADASFTRQSQTACAILTADCLPVLITNRSGTQVAAAHAGWRGLAAGVLRETLKTFDDDPEDILIYLGPAIGPQHFEVGIDVLEHFFESACSESQADAIAACFAPSPTRPLHFLADLYGLARAELVELGVTAIYGGNACTYTDTEHFYSYRRDGVTGRMASLIWLT